MQDTDLSASQIETINYARLWIDDENNRHNEEMLRYQELAEDANWSPGFDDTGKVLVIKNKCQNGDTSFFGCIVGGCPLLFADEDKRNFHQTEHQQRLAVPIAPTSTPTPPVSPGQPVPQVNRPCVSCGGIGPTGHIGTCSAVARVSVPQPLGPGSPNPGAECYGCGKVFANYPQVKTHRMLTQAQGGCDKSKSINKARTYKGGYTTAFYTCFNCNYFTAGLATVKSHAAKGCTKRHPDDEIGYDFTCTQSTGSVGQTAIENGVGWLYTENGWEKMVDVAVKINPAYNPPNRGALTTLPQAPPPAPLTLAQQTPAPNLYTPAPVPTAQPALHNTGLDLSVLNPGRYASIDEHGRVWFFLISVRKKDSTEWGWKHRPAGTIEVKRYESDNTRMIGWQKPGETYRYDNNGFAHHNDDLQYIMAAPAQCAKLYAIETGHCYVCGKQLTDPVSLARGIGPDCFGQGKGYKKHGGTW